MSVQAVKKKERRLAVTAGDVEVFRWLWMLRAMTLEQIRRVRYYQPSTGQLSSFDNVRKRLMRLWEAGYLVGDRVLETNERVYFLAPKALSALREYHGIEQRRLYQPRGADTMFQLMHPLLVAECAVRITEALRGSDLTLTDLPPYEVPFYHTHTMNDPSERRHVHRFLTQDDIVPAGETETYRIRPDLVFALTSRDAASRLYFLEADRGTESPAEIARKQVGYFHYQTARNPKSPERFLWQRYGNQRDFRVLLLTTDERRVQRLREQLATKPGFDLMAFSSLDTVGTQNMVFDGVWTTASGSSNPLAVRASGE